MKPIKFDFETPKKYRREFHLILKTSRHGLLVKRSGIYIMAFGTAQPGDQSKILDWIQDSIMQVRHELGHP